MYKTCISKLLMFKFNLNKSIEILIKCVFQHTNISPRLSWRGRKMQPMFRRCEAQAYVCNQYQEVVPLSTGWSSNEENTPVSWSDSSYYLAAFLFLWIKKLYIIVSPKCFLCIFYNRSATFTQSPGRSSSHDGCWSPLVRYQPAVYTRTVPI